MLHFLTNGDSPDKANPFVRRGRKAAGLLGKKMAELPKDKPEVSSAFLSLKILCKNKRFLNLLEYVMRKSFLKYPIQRLQGDFVSHWGLLSFKLR